MRLSLRPQARSNNTTQVFATLLKARSYMIRGCATSICGSMPHALFRWLFCNHMARVRLGFPIYAAHIKKEHLAFGYKALKREPTGVGLGRLIRGR